jgi:hypothetical protein
VSLFQWILPYLLLSIKKIRSLHFLRRKCYIYRRLFCIRSHIFVILVRYRFLCNFLLFSFVLQFPEPLDPDSFFILSIDRCLNRDINPFEQVQSSQLEILSANNFDAFHFTTPSLHSYFVGFHYQKPGIICKTKSQLMALLEETEFLNKYLPVSSFIHSIFFFFLTKLLYVL